MSENQIRVFRFWFNDALHDGTHFQNELYYRAMAVETDRRTRVYHLACKLSDHQASTLVSLTEAQCSLWISLRSQTTAADRFSDLIAGLFPPGN
ncbi:MAG: hypothetical protein HC922_00480 [Leptolyngbyaceae cyanobacterium SM2_3_12]|nr:hypothetical protein [Leptolyngbyaceae cyanobacterium SM2_3_12]